MTAWADGCANGCFSRFRGVLVVRAVARLCLAAECDLALPGLPAGCSLCSPPSTTWRYRFCVYLISRLLLALLAAKCDLALHVTPAGCSLCSLPSATWRYMVFRLLLALLAAGYDLALHFRQVARAGSLALWGEST